MRRRLGRLAVLLLVLPPCHGCLGPTPSAGNGDATVESVLAKLEERYKGLAAEDVLPQDVSIPPQSRAVDADIAPDGARTVSATVPGPVDQQVVYFRQTLATRGWAERSRRSEKSMSVDLEFGKPGRTLILHVSPSTFDGYSTVVLVLADDGAAEH